METNTVPEMILIPYDAAVELVKNGFTTDPQYINWELADEKFVEATAMECGVGNRARWIIRNCADRSGTVYGADGYSPFPNNKQQYEYIESHDLWFRQNEHNTIENRGEKYIVFRKCNVRVELKYTFDYQSFNEEM